LKQPAKSWRIAVDTGGTFTDLELLHSQSGKRLSHKTPTTPDDPSTGLIRGIQEICQLAEIRADDLSGLMHGTTIATNAILEERFPRAALVTTHGFRDVLEIGRHVRTDVYSQIAEPRPNLIPRRFRFEVKERVRANGDVETPVNKHDLEKIGDRLSDESIDVIAISLLHSYANSQHEQEVAEYFSRRFKRSYISRSSEISPEAREYERTATTVLNALLMPVVRDYLEHLRSRLRELDWTFPIYLVQSNGGVTTPEIAGEQPVRLVLSGPSGGVRAAEILSDRLQQPNLVAIDMGGTSFDVSIIKDGRAHLRTDGKVGAMPVRVPMLEMHTIGAGGGSIAGVDDAGRLSVGPHSAGAEPGPAAYALGGSHPTVTDANVLLGRIAVDRFLGGSMTLNASAAQEAMQTRVAEPLGLADVKAADGVIRIAISHMASAIRLALFEKGLDPRDFVLISFGGAGGLHAALVAEELGSACVVFPTQCGTLSAWGMLHSDIAHDVSRTNVCAAADDALVLLATMTEQLTDVGQELLDRSQADSEKRFHDFSVDMRYPGQGWEISVPVDAPLNATTMERLRNRFHQTHQEQFAHSDTDVVPELVTLRNRAVGRLERPQSEQKTGVEHIESDRPAEFRKVFLQGQFESVPILERSGLAAGTQIVGPAIIEEQHSTILIPAHWNAIVGTDGTVTARFRETMSS